jgi:hypothetical protein
MRACHFYFFFLVLLMPEIKAQGKIVLEGTYDGQNLYIQNPHISDSGYCTIKVLVNDSEVPFENASAYEIDLRSLHLKEYEPVRVEILHHENCKPQVLNMDRVRRRKLCILSIQLTNDTLKWTVPKEEAKTIYLVEQFKWNKWVKVGELIADEDSVEHTYSYRVQLHSGKNKLRVKKMVNPAKYEPSNVVESDSKLKPVTYSIDKVKRQITFSGETLYELYDQWGNILKRDTGITIDCSDLKRGMYFLNYDDKTGELNLY